MEAQESSGTGRIKSGKMQTRPRGQHMQRLGSLREQGMLGEPEWFDMREACLGLGKGKAWQWLYMRMGH